MRLQQFKEWLSAVGFHQQAAAKHPDLLTSRILGFSFDTQNAVNLAEERVLNMDDSFHTFSMKSQVNERQKSYFMFAVVVFEPIQDNIDTVCKAVGTQPLFNMKGDTMLDGPSDAFRLNNPETLLKTRIVGGRKFHMN